MTSGIYKLTFSNGNFYIGKSNNIDRRWSEHWDKFSKGTAAKQLQQHVHAFGYPSREVVWECHPHHLDIVETYFINKLWGSRILNTTKPTPASEEDYLTLLANRNTLKYSTADLVADIRNYKNKSEKLIEELDRTNLECDYEISQIKTGTKIPKLEAHIEQLVKDNYKLRESLRVLKARGFFARLFNL